MRRCLRVFLVVCVPLLGAEACSGRDTTGSATAAPPLRLRSISAGNMFTCGLDEDRALWCWGVNSYGQLGMGDQKDRPVPVRVPVGTPVARLAIGDARVCVVDSLSTLRCWGDNVGGALADSTITRRSTPAVMPFGQASQVTAGSRFTCATNRAGQAYCWGGDRNGELGDGGDTVSSRLTYERVAVDVAFDTLVAGRIHACGLTTDGTAWCWGGAGLAGDGSREKRLVPVRVAGVHQFRSLTAGYSATCGIARDDSAWCWGIDHDGQLGRGGASEDTFTPARVAGGHRFRQLAAGYHRVCGLDLDGRAWCWGSNFNGALGDTGRVSSLSPVPVRGDRRYIAIASGDSHACALEASGSAWCWGQNRLGDGGGALGDGTVDDRAFPVPVSSAGSVRIDTANAATRARS